MADFKAYEAVVGKKVMDELRRKAKKFSGKHILNINSTYQGGGVSEILNSLTKVINELGVGFGWRILHGTPDFFSITKKFHNGLQGEEINLSKRKKFIYNETNRRFSKYTHIHHDLVIIHDPQPLPLIEFYTKNQPWIFRCHIDISKPNKKMWDYLKTYIKKYNLFVFSRKEYKKKLKINQRIIYPAIDPLTDKNKETPTSEVNKFLKGYGIKLDKPIISQISRFDKWKDPIGVIDVFEMVKKEVDCRLVMLGSFATDDPEGEEMYEEVKQRAANSKYSKDIKIIPIENDFLVNALQRKSEVVIQKSLKEGFGLTVAEALFKRTPVVASSVGGIPLQVIDGATGFLHKPKDVKGFAGSVVKLLKDKEQREHFGEHGREHIKNNFLITRLVSDWFDVFDELLFNNHKSKPSKKTKRKIKERKYNKIKR